MIYFLLVVYVLVVVWWIKSSPLFAIDGLSRPLISFVFLSKVFAGLVYGAIHTSYFHGGDTFLFLKESTLIGNTFFSYPEYYIRSIFGLNAILPSAEVFTYPDSALFWKDLGTYVLVHVHAFLHIFTFGHYELHIVFIAIVGLFASLNFYKLFNKILDLPKPILIISCFFLPSLTFWTAGLHKDVYVYFGLSLFLLALYEGQGKGRSNKTTFKFIASIIVIGLARHYLLILLIPAAIAYLITLRTSRRIWTTYIFVCIISAFIGVVFTRVFIGIEVFEILASKQAAFLAEVGGSSLQNVESFEPTFWGVLGMAPIATINVMGRPFIWECQDFLQVLACIEIMCFLGLIVFALALKRKSVQSPNLLLKFIIVYSLCNLLLIGLLVPNAGTIVRYRSISLGLLSALLIHFLGFVKLGLYSKSSSKKNVLISTYPTRSDNSSTPLHKKKSVLN